MCPADLDVRDYWERRLAEHADLQGVGWMGLGKSFNEWMYKVRAHVFSTAVRRAAGSALSGLRILDVGSGTGFYLEAWRRLGVREVSGSDLTEVAVERLRLRYPGTDVRRLDIGSDEESSAGSAYDAVSAMDVLFHIVDDAAYRQAFRNLAALLRPGGILILSENFLRQAPARSPHQVSRSETVIAEILEETGLEQIALRPMFCLMNTPVDSSNRILHAWWRLLTRTVSMHDIVGFAVGAALYPLEIACVRTLPRGPSTKLTVCRKR